MEIFSDFFESIATLYKQTLGIELTRNAINNGVDPVWDLLSKEDFLSSGQNAGLLLDPEVGLALFVIKYEDGTDLNAEIRQALKISDKLQPAYQPKKPDKNGTWQVALFWLIEGLASEKSWKTAIAERRKQSGFSEEIALDALFFEKGADIREILTPKRLPLLLLHTRKLFRMSNESIAQWHSANSEVREMLIKFPERFRDAKQNEIARQIVQDALDYKLDSVADPYPQEPESVNHLGIKNFRNIQSCELSFGSPIDKKAVVPKVIFGPNGTGKTALFEALSLAICGTSGKLRTYLQDDDVSPKQSYMEKVLRPLRYGAGNTELSLNGIPTLGFIDKVETAYERLQLMEGTLLEQEDSRSFASLEKKELATRVLRGYSTLADYVQQKTEDGFIQENQKRQKLLSEYGLSQAIRKVETLRERVLGNVLGKELAPPSASLAEWLDRLGQLLPDGKQWSELASSWTYWSNEGAKFTFLEFIKDGKAITLSTALKGRIYQRRQLVYQTQTALDSLRTQASLMKEDISRTVNDLDIWAKWLEFQKTELSPTPANEEIALLQEILVKKQLDRTKLNIDGKDLRGRDEHLQSAQRFIETWGINHSTECPTCAADYADKGGIALVAESVRKANLKLLENLRGRYSELNIEIKDIETRLLVLGRSECPINQDRQEEIMEFLQGIAPPESTEEWLRDSESRERVVNALESLQVIPVLPALSGDDMAEVQRISEIILSRLTDASLVWEAPEQWQTVKKVLDAACMEIVQSHMPRTLQLVWSELLFALTPARWNLAAEPEFEFKLARGNNEMRVIAKKYDREILARYLFNQAEIHLLGLAWFFMRYFSHGRFRYSLIAMDDPAQEMDQTTYRAFTRFLQTILRLHKHSERPFTMLLFLHQEDRALDAARATDGLLNVLSWEQEQSEHGEYKHALTEVKLLSEQFSSVNPNFLFSSESKQQA